MTRRPRYAGLTLLASVCAAAPAFAQQTPATTTPVPPSAAPAAPAPATTPAATPPVTSAPAPATSAPTTAAAQPAAPDSLVVYFATGSAAIRQQDEDVLDHASRLYRDGHPLLMLLAGSTDSVGSPDRNLSLSEQRAQAVFRALVARGIPAERFQVLAKGATEPAVAAGQGADEPRNRRVEITWR